MPSLAQMRHDARAIFDAGLEGADPIRAIGRHVRFERNLLWVSEQPYDLAIFDQLYVIGAGKAAAKMALALEELLVEKIRKGVVNVKYGHSMPLSKIKVNEGGHPLPDELGARGTEEIIELLGKTGDRELVLAVLSGGGSALLTAPADGLTLDDKQRTTQALLDSGAKIGQMNAIRKHLSKVKGGRLARLAYPSMVVSLILSDVIGDAVDAIASGPTAADPSTYSDCIGVIERFSLRDRIPSSAIKLLERGERGEIGETPKPGDPTFRRVQNVVVGNNASALVAAKERAQGLGYSALILSDPIVGEAKEAAVVHANLAKRILIAGTPVPTPACVISGGETTVTIHGGGLGGRNQEFGLAAAIAIDGSEGAVVLSGGTDGTDGCTDAAGAIVDGTTLARGRTRGLDAEDYLRRNDSHRFLGPVGDLLITGPTFTNVMDLQIVLVA